VSVHNLGQIASDGCNNLSFFGRKSGLSAPLAQSPQPRLAYNASTTYLGIVAGDGFSAACAVESGFSCAGGSSSSRDTCDACGNSIRWPSEGCDDGNSAAGDGCSAGCAVEVGYSCTGGGVSAKDSCRTVCGDGSIMMNIQELQTIKEYGLPTKIFLLCNDGYHSIYQTQKNFFSDNVIGCGPGNGLSFPDFIKIAAAFDIPSREVIVHSKLDQVIADMLEAEGAQICIVHLDKAQPFAPKLSSRRLPDGRMVTSPLEDMAPFLDREELRTNLLIPPLND
jgi:cysteine-rich repeat protein